MKVRNVFVKTQNKTYCFNDVEGSDDIRLRLQALEGVPLNLQRLSMNSKPVPSVLPANCTITLSLALLGGKGGFGAKLKNEGSKKVRSNNNSHSRDLTGRRIRNVNMEKDYIDSYKKKLEENKIVKSERQKFKQMENTLYEEHAFMRLDKNYTAQLENGQKTIEDAVKIGLKYNWLKSVQAKEMKAKKLKEDEQEVELKPDYPSKPIERRSQRVEDKDKPEPATEQPKEKTDKLEQQFKNEDKPRKLMRQQAPAMDKVQAQRIVTDILTKPLDMSTGSLTSAASKLKSLFKK